MLLRLANVTRQSGRQKWARVRSKLIFIAAAFTRTGGRVLVATNVNLHGTRPWHPKAKEMIVLVATNVNLHGASPWHPKAKEMIVSAIRGSKPSPLLSSVMSAVRLLQSPLAAAVKR